MIKIVVPTLGESVTEATVGDWRVSAGDAVKKDDILVDLETDKVSVEVRAEEDGVITAIIADAGETVAIGAKLAEMSVVDKSAARAADVAPTPSATRPPAPSGTEIKVMPSARRVAAENNLELSKVAGAGKDGRITKGDALRALRSDAAAPVPYETGSREERVKMTRLRQTIARRLKTAQNTAAILTTYNEADMSVIMDLRKQVQEDFIAKHGVKLGFMSFFVKACVAALKDIPAVNAEIDGDDIVYKNFYDMGVAVGTDRGLVVPVVRNADRLSLAEIETSIMNLGRRAHEARLDIDEMQGASFTISNGGVYGSLLSAPILNAPQSGILGMHKIQKRPVAIDGEVKIRPMMYLALSYDHRIVDGKEAVTFLVRVKESLENPQRLMLDI